MAPHPFDCIIGLGSNLGDRRATLSDAVGACSLLGRVEGVSALYETDPVGGPGQPEFLNAALRLNTRLRPPALLEQLQQIEITAGRQRTQRWGPRTLDLDILWIRGQTWTGPALDVPHPRLLERPFALIPMLDLVPDATDPHSGIPYRRVLATLDRTGVRRVPQSAHWAGHNA